MLTITQRAVKLGVKNGYGFTQFCEKFQCNQEDFQHAVRSLFGTRGGNEVIKDIRSNTKKIEKAIKKTCKPDPGMRVLEESHPTPLEEWDAST